MSLHLPMTLGPLCGCAADDQGRYSMNGVQVTDPQDGTFCCVVTDGRELLIARGVCPQRGELRPDAAPQTSPSVVVPTAAWQELFRKVPALDRFPRAYAPHRNGTASVGIEWNAQTGKLFLTAPDRTMRYDQIDGRFPDWTQVLPKGKPAFCITVNPEMLIELLKAVGSLLPKESRRLTLAFWKPDVPLAVVAKNPETGLCLDGMLMPLYDPPRPKQEEVEEEDEAEGEEDQEQESSAKENDNA